MNDKRFASWRDTQRRRIDLAIDAALPKGKGPLDAAMRYCASGAGKRMRPLLCLATAADLGGARKAMHAACAVELIHCYSLVHDDLPCMDDDDMRRGKKSCHRMHGEAIALLAGDALLTLSFAQLARAGLGDKAHSLLSGAAGHAGMVGGQAQDIMGTARKPAQLQRMHSMKTGRLIQVAVELGAMCANATRAQTERLSDFGKLLGFAYQVADDINDATGSLSSTGKVAGQDKRRGRKTMVTTMGLLAASRCLAKEKKAIEAKLENLPNNGARLRGMFNSIFCPAC